MDLFDGKYTNQIIDLINKHPLNDTCAECGRKYVYSELVLEANVLVSGIKKRKNGMYYKKRTPTYQIKPIAKVPRKWVLKRFCCEGCYKKWVIKIKEDLEWIQQAKKIKKQITTAIRGRKIHSLQEAWKLLPKELKQEKTSLS